MNQIIPMVIGAIVLIVVAALQWALIARLEARQRSGAREPGFEVVPPRTSTSDELAQVATAASGAVQAVIEEKSLSPEDRIVLYHVRTELDNFNAYVMHGTTPGKEEMSLSALSLLLRTEFEHTTMPGRTNRDVVRQVAADVSRQIAGDSTRSRLFQPGAVVTLGIAKDIMERLVDEDPPGSEEVAS